MATAILIILDGMGVGQAPDAADYGDVGSNTLANMARVTGGVHAPTLAAMGLGHLTDIQGVPAGTVNLGSYGRLQEISAGKDSTTGHWELMGVVTEQPYPTYPQGFPEDVLSAFTEATGYGVLGNKAASGTDIIAELGQEHLDTGKLIVYTSADSVFQIAAHDAVCPLEELYRVCAIARELLQGEHCVSRVIARPFTTIDGQFQRTPYRKDYSVSPPQSMYLNILKDAGIWVQSIGKIYDLYNGYGINESIPSKNNPEGMATLERVYAEHTTSDRLILLNLVDFDMLWGHRNDPQGMKQGLEQFDAWLVRFLATMQAGDALFITADHGNDPTTPTTDHSRELVPILAHIKGAQAGVDLGTRQGFMDVGATLLDYFNLGQAPVGQSFLSQLRLQ